MPTLPSQVPTPNTSPASSELIYLVSDPYGSPADDAATAGNVIINAHGLSDGYVEVSGGVMITNAGQAGPTGPAGACGVSGVSGVPGACEVSGTAGAAGACGVSGTAGAAGACGVSGTAGAAGACGVSGTAGAAGACGVSGTAGACGVSGVSGIPGFEPTVGTVSVSSNAGTASATYGVNNFTNSSAATMAITLGVSTPTPNDGQLMIVRIYDASGVAETIGWTNTENSNVAAPLQSNGSTTLPLSVGFQYNGSTSKWRCLASA